MNGGHIYTIGETVFDIIFRDGQPVAGMPGGAMLNAAVSLGRMNFPVSFISEVGKDTIGNQILVFLQKNKVNCKFLHTFHEGKTALSLAYLNEKEEAHYDFYKIYPENRLGNRFPKLDAKSMVLFGSFYALTEAVRQPLMRFVRKARKSGSLVMYDPNIRKPHALKIPQLRDFLDENFRMADVVRGSADDFMIIYNTADPHEIFEQINKLGCHYVIITNAEKPVRFISESIDLKMQVDHHVELKSTVGAGDSFNAGVLYGLCKMNTDRESLASLKEADWKILVDLGITFGSSVCESYENYISVDLAKKLDRNGKK